MKRSMFLGLCVQAAVKKDKPKVLYAGIEYYPEGYETIRDFNDATADLEADKDENGNPVSGSKKEKVVEAINKLPLSRKQKNLLYLSRGYSEKDLNSLPWN